MTLQFYFLLQNPLKPCFLLLRPYFLPLPRLISTSCLLYHSPCTLDLPGLLCPTFPSSYSFSFFLTFVPKILTSCLLYIFSFSLYFASPPSVSCPPWPNSWPLYPPSCPLCYYSWDPPDLPPSPCLGFPFCSPRGSVHPSHSFPNRCRPTFK